MSIRVIHDREIFQLISQEIEKAQVSIKAAIAWFMDPELEFLLSKKSDIVEGLILANHSGNDTLKFNGIKKKVYYLNHENNVLMHHKFCIIDNKKVITGSYNWTVKARRYNKENVLLIEDQNVVNQYEKIYSDLIYISIVKDSLNRLITNDFDAIENIEVLNQELKFNKEIDDKLREIKKYKMGYVAQSFVDNHTAVIAAEKIVMLAQDAPNGLIKLWENKRLDLSFEESVIRNEHKSLFTDQIIQRAKSKLEKLNFFTDPIYLPLMGRY